MYMYQAIVWIGILDYKKKNMSTGRENGRGNIVHVPVLYI
jgi:hypothetical protein